jgi:hypothetical protein
LTETKFFGVLNFLPRFHPQIAGGTQIYNNLNLLIEIYLKNFNFLGIDISNNLLKIFNASLFIFILIYIISRSIDIYRNGNLGERIFLLFSTMSILSISGSFLLTNMQPDISSARYLINAEYFIIMLLLFIFLKSVGQKNTRVTYLVYALAFCLSIVSLASNLKYSSISIPVIQKNARAASVERVLRANHLNYGYGTYWGSMANSVTVETNGEITIRPVVFDSNGDVHFQGRLVTSNLWYLAADLPPSPSQRFLLVSNGVEGCISVQKCVESAVARFGPPIRSIPFEQDYILVWNHEILH